MAFCVPCESGADCPEHHTPYGGQAVGSHDTVGLFQTQTFKLDPYTCYCPKMFIKCKCGHGFDYHAYHSWFCLLCDERMNCMSFECATCGKEWTP